jgi:transposase
VPASGCYMHAGEGRSTEPLRELRAGSTGAPPRDLLDGVSKQYRPWRPEQTFLLPPSPMEWLPEGHLAYFVMEVVSELDLGAIEGPIQQKDPRGERPYSPQMMTSLLLYAYCVGVFSSRKIERATHEDVAFRVIAGGGHPHFTTVNAFRLAHHAALSQLFVQVLQVCKGAGLTTAGHLSLDGSKVQANASKHKAMSYGRMKDDEKRLAAEVEALLGRANEVDAQEDEIYGRAVSGNEVPEELKRREERLHKIREVKAALEKEAAESRARRLRENAAELRKKIEDGTLPARERKAAGTLAGKSEAQAQKIAPRDDDNAGGTQLPLHRIHTEADGTPENKAQRNFTDPDSRIMIRNNVFMQAYNAQAVVSEDQIIVAHGVTNAPSDVEQLTPMLERVRENVGQPATILSADSGYISEKNITYCAKNGVDAYIAVGKAAAAKLSCVPDSEALLAHWAMHDKVASPMGKKIYARRKVIVEPVFGQIKSAMGFRRFSLRGLLKVPSEWAIVCACHNLLKLFRLKSSQRLAAATG